MERTFIGALPIPVPREWIMDMDAAMLNRLRAIRLYHWREMLKARKRADRSAELRDQSISRMMPKYEKYWMTEWEKHNKLANTHLGFVQSLNDLFPLGDTAEKDAA